MRKIILSFIAAVSIQNLSFGQAILEHSYTTRDWNWDETNAFKTDAGLNYYTVEGTNTLKFYNSSHSLTTTVTIPIDSGYSLNGIYCLSDKLFNTDGLIEFLVVSTIYTNSTNIFKLTLINEQGTILQQMGNRNEIHIVKSPTSNQFKLITMLDSYANIEGTGYKYDVYSLPGTSLGTVMLNKNASSFFGYPNPTGNKIAITNNLENGQNGTLEVFDTNEKKVMQKNIVGENGEINLDVSKLSNGVYIYKLNGQTNRFIKNY